MAREIRESGLNLCGAGVVGNVVVGASSSAWLNWDAGGLEGYEGDVAMPVVSTGTAEAERVAGTDGIIIRSGTLLDGAVIASHPASSSAITLNTTNHGFSTGDILMACDYRQAVIFQATSASAASADIGHASGSQTPGNCTGDFPLDCSSEDRCIASPRTATSRPYRSPPGISETTPEAAVHSTDGHWGCATGDRLECERSPA